jgi:ribonuclease H / adenosylcobalamin/alpha-ribazole phosphatase
LERALANEHFDFAVASDLQRAHDTARAIVGERIPVMLDARWREFDFGAWEGLTWDEIAERWPESAVDTPYSAASYHPQGGESFDDVCARVADALNDLRAGQHHNVLVVTHAGPLHAMLRVLFSGENKEGQEMSGVRFLPASITRVRFIDGRAELVSLNEARHLDCAG